MADRLRCRLCNEVTPAADVDAAVIRMIEHVNADHANLRRSRALSKFVIFESGYPPVHNHGPEEGPGLSCRETRDPDGNLRGACVRAAGSA